MVTLDWFSFNCSYYVFIFLWSITFLVGGFNEHYLFFPYFVVYCFISDMKIEKKDLIQIAGIGTLLIFLILPSYWLSQFLLYKTSIYSFLGSFCVYLFPCCFLSLGIIQGLLWQNKKIALSFAIWIIVVAMLSCFLFYQFILQFLYQLDFSWSGFLIFVGTLIIHGFLVWSGFKLAYYGEK